VFKPPKNIYNVKWAVAYVMIILLNQNSDISVALERWNPFKTEIKIGCLFIIVLFSKKQDKQMDRSLESPTKTDTVLSFPETYKHVEREKSSFLMSQNYVQKMKN